jgi:hypothetical protein
LSDYHRHLLDVWNIIPQIVFQCKEDTPSMLGMDINTLTDFEQALLETERRWVERSIRDFGDEAPLLEDNDRRNHGEEDSLLHNSGSSGFISYGSPGDSQAFDEMPEELNV